AARRGIAATQGQHLIDAQAAAGQVVPALEVGNADIVACGDGPQRVAVLDPVVVAAAGGGAGHRGARGGRRLTRVGRNAQHLADPQVGAFDAVDVLQHAHRQVVTAGDGVQAVARTHLVLVPVHQV